MLTVQIKDDSTYFFNLYASLVAWTFLLTVLSIAKDTPDAELMESPLHHEFCP